MNKDISIHLTIVRHGRTIYNCREIIQGQLDIPLDQEGIQQAIAAGVYLKDEHFDCVYSSDLCRAVRTASEIIQQNKISNKNLLGIKRDTLLRERGWGILEGRPKSDKQKAANDAGLFGEEEENRFVPRNGESVNDKCELMPLPLPRLVLLPLLQLTSAQFRTISDGSDSEIGKTFHKKIDMTKMIIFRHGRQGSPRVSLG